MSVHRLFEKGVRHAPQLHSSCWRPVGRLPSIVEWLNVNKGREREGEGAVVSLRPRAQIDTIGGRKERKSQKNHWKELVYESEIFKIVMRMGNKDNKGVSSSSSSSSSSSRNNDSTGDTRGTNCFCEPMKAQSIAVGNGESKGASINLRSIKLVYSPLVIRRFAVVVMLVIGCLANKIVLANAKAAGTGGYEVHKHDTSEKIKIGNAKTNNFNFQGSHYLPTQLTQVVLNVPKIKKSRTDRPPTVEEFALKERIKEIYQEAKQELGASEQALHFSHLGRVIEALNPKYIATVRVYDAAFSDPANPASLVPLPEMQPEYFQLDSTADQSTIPMQLDSLNLKFREYFGWDQAFVNLLANYEDDLLSPDQLAFKRLLMCLSQPELCGLAGLNLHKPDMFDVDSESEHDEHDEQDQDGVSASSEVSSEGDDDDDDEDDDDDDNDDNKNKSDDQNSVARAFVSYGNGLSPDGPSIQASSYAGSGPQPAAEEPSKPEQPQPPLPPHNPYQMSSSPPPPPPPAPPAPPAQQPAYNDMYSDQENHYQQLGASTGYSPVNIYAKLSKPNPYQRSNSQPSSMNKYANAIFTPPNQQRVKQQRPTSIISSLAKRLGQL